jgi:hypothetical protein
MKEAEGEGFEPPDNPDTAARARRMNLFWNADKSGDMGVYELQPGCPGRADLNRLPNEVNHLLYR